MVKYHYYCFLYQRNNCVVRIKLLNQRRCIYPITFPLIINCSLSSLLPVQVTPTTAVHITPAAAATKAATMPPVDGTAATASNTRNLCGLKAPCLFTLTSQSKMALSPSAPFSGHSVSSSSPPSHWQTPFPSLPAWTCLTLVLRSSSSYWLTRTPGTQMGR